MNNPAFALIEVDEATMLPINYQIYGIDLDEANRKGVADWKLLIDYVKDYNMTEMSPNGLLDLSERIMTDNYLLKKFKWGESRFVGNPKLVHTGEGKAKYCEFTMFTPNQEADCLEKKHESIVVDPVGWIFDNLIGDWKVKAGKT